MKLFFVRHGRSEDNENKIIQGTRDSPLIEKGIKQAERVAERLKENKFDKIIVSPLSRTKDTAEKIIQYHDDVEVELDENFMEYSYGVIQGKPKEFLKKKLEEVGVPRYEYKPKGGTSLVEYYDKMKEIYKEIKNSDYGDRILIVSHSGTIRTFLLAMEGRRYEDDWDNTYYDYKVDNCSLTVVDLKKEQIELLNCTEHLN